MSDCDDQNTDGVDATTVKKPIGDGLMIISLTATTAAIFLGLRLADMRKGNTLLTSTSLVWFVSTCMVNVIKTLCK